MGSAHKLPWAHRDGLSRWSKHISLYFLCERCPVTTTNPCPPKTGPELCYVWIHRVLTSEGLASHNQRSNKT